MSKASFAEGPTGEVEILKAQIAKLEATIAALEQRVHWLEDDVETSKLREPFRC